MLKLNSTMLKIKRILMKFMLKCIGKLKKKCVNLKSSGDNNILMLSRKLKAMRLIQLLSLKVIRNSWQGCKEIEKRRDSDGHQDTNMSLRNY